MTMSATFYYRRNIDSVPNTIKRVMHKLTISVTRSSKRRKNTAC